MRYFAYGSNMSTARLRARAPSAVPIGVYKLVAHDLRFHKLGLDGSAKCDAFFTAREQDAVYGVVFEIAPIDKPALDSAEGLGRGYQEKRVSLACAHGPAVDAFVYVATHFSSQLKPYSWYLNHVLVGAREAALPEAYIEQKLLQVIAVEDADAARDAQQRALHRQR